VTTVRHWRVKPGFNEIRLVPEPAVAPVAGAQRLDGDFAVGRLSEWFRSGVGRSDEQLLASICRALDGPLTARDGVRGWRRRLGAALRSGRLVAFRIPNDLAGQYRPPPEEQEHEAALTTAKDWIEIRLVDEAGVPVRGEPYAITLPDGGKRRGISNADGVVRFERIESGVCDFTLTEVEAAAWGPT
jgi:hypothetical protein